MPPLNVLPDAPGPAAPEARPDLSALPAAGAEGLYVHVPFCFHKCHYCDFYSITRQTPERMRRFVELVLAEARLWRQAPVELRPRTVFFGGGTPSLLPRDDMARLLDGLREAIDLSAVEEWTIEVNPATADLDDLWSMRSRGVDRVSFGAQSFRPSELLLLERHHDPADVPRAVGLAREAGFERLNLDLIYAIPGQSLDDWRYSLDAALALGTDHLSCYNLTYEPHTALEVRRRLGRLEPVSEQTELAMFRDTRAALAAAGLPAYEVSNHARPGAACRHNLVYWTGGNYVGLGPSAASHVEGWRWRNAPHLGRWEAAVSAGELPAIEAEHLSPGRRAGELAMLALRLEQGLVFSDFERRTGEDAHALFADPIARYAAAGLLAATPTGVRLTEAGWPLADAVASEFLAATA